MIDDRLELLDEAECRRLLAQGGIGRVGMTSGVLPVILPVNFALIDGDIVFRTGEGSKLHATRGGAVIAFEVDAYDVPAERGWSVLAVGRAREVSDDDDLEQLRLLHLAPWANGERTHFVRLRPELITGRRIATR